MKAQATHLSGSVSANQLADAIEGGSALRLLDVRTPGEFRRGHIAGSANVPLAVLHEHVAELGAGTEPIVLVCRSGARARTAEAMVREAGARKVHILDGGVLAWRATGRPVDRAEGAFTWSLGRLAGAAALVAAVALWREQPLLTLMLAIVGVRMLLGQPALPCMGGACRS